MARGWESKSIEAQQEEASSKPSPDKPRLTKKEADCLREKESLRLSLRRITDQIERSQKPHDHPSTNGGCPMTGTRPRLTPGTDHPITLERVSSRVVAQSGSVVIAETD